MLGQTRATRSASSRHVSNSPNARYALAGPSLHPSAVRPRCFSVSHHFLSPVTPLAETAIPDGCRPPSVEDAAMPAELVDAGRMNGERKTRDVSR